MEIASIIVILIMGVSITLTIVFLLAYLFRRKRTRLRKAAISFATAVSSLGLLIIAEELFFSYNFEDKKEVLVASREAQLDGIVLKLYEDSTFEIGGFREVKSNGTFELRSDTLYITSGGNEYLTKQSFIIKDGDLKEIGSTDIGFLEVHVNRLNKQGSSQKDK